MSEFVKPVEDEIPPSSSKEKKRKEVVRVTALLGVIGAATMTVAMANLKNNRLDPDRAVILNNFLISGITPTALEIRKGKLLRLPFSDKNLCSLIIRRRGKVKAAFFAEVPQNVSCNSKRQEIERLAMLATSEHGISH